MKTIFINAGHSKEDSGAVVPNRRKESDLAMSLRDIVSKESDNLGLHFIFVPDHLNLRQSINWVNERATKDDIAISIHFNANKNLNIEGVEAYYSNFSNLAEIFTRNIAKLVPIRNRGVRHDSETWVGSLGWLRNLNCPSVLLECGYLTNDKDYGIITLPSNQRKMALGIINGIIEYIVREENSTIYNTLSLLENKINTYKVNLILNKFRS